MENLSHYPVRLPKGDVCCYSCAAALLDRLSDFQEDEMLRVRIGRARESVEMQVECCRRVLEVEERWWVGEGLGV